MRVWVAGCFVFGSVLIVVAIFGAFDLFESVPPMVGGAAISVLMAALVAVSLWLFNRNGTNALGLLSPEEHIERLERAGLLESLDFQAVRAFEVEELEDEGLHYFLELRDGRVLFLSGQYLYDYEAISDEPELNQPRKFPCEAFTIRRHRTERYIVDIQCHGSVIEPEMTAPAFGVRVWEEGGIPGNGEIITHSSYEALKNAHTRNVSGA